MPVIQSDADTLATSMARDSMARDSMAQNSIKRPVARRPVLTRDEATAVCARLLSLSSADVTTVTLRQNAYGITRINRSRVRTSVDGGGVSLSFRSRFGGKGSVELNVNQLDDATLRTIVPYVEQLAKTNMGPAVSQSGPDEVIGPRTYPTVQLWHDSSIEALGDTRTVPLTPIFNAVREAKLHSAVFVGASASISCIMRNDGAVAFGEQTDTELTVTCWTPDFVGSGWGGQAARNWSTIDPGAVVNHAVDLASRSAKVVAVEPGRRTAILGPAAVAQLVRLMASAFDATETIEYQSTPFSKARRSSTIGTRVFDTRITMRSDPNDPDGGYLPFFQNAMPSAPITWIEAGMHKNLAYDPKYGALMGKSPYARIPSSVRLSGGTATVEEMISSCKEGIYVNRFSSVDLLDDKTGMMSGVTRDGCFLIRNGAIHQAVKNFRFLESPWFILNNLEMIGAPHRASFGYTPNGDAWPLQPVIVPPLMVRDFNFTALAEAM